MKTIYMDISGMLLYPHMTGIQRVLSEVVVRLIGAQKERGVKVVLLRHVRDMVFSVCDCDLFMAYYKYSTGDKQSCVTAQTITVDQLDPSSFWLDMDSVWNDMLPRHMLYPELAKRNIQIGVYVYDVIVFSHPQYCAKDNFLRFPPYMAAVFDWADCIFTEAAFTRDQIRQLARDVGCERPIEYFVVPPGANFSERSDTGVDETIRQIVKRGKILLTVSTLEARKNHKVLLDAFDASLCEMGYQMVFVGQTGWKVEELIERIKTHPENGRSLFHLQGISDDALHYLYKNASFVLFASYIEGYGLATVEAMQYGVPTVLSDVPVMREVGGDYCDYFDPDAPEQLVEIIRRYEQQPALYAAKREELKSYRPPTWDECAQTMLDGILAFRTPAPGAHKVEQIVILSARQEDLLPTLAYVEGRMPFIRKVLILCPKPMAASLPGAYQGRLEMTCLADDDLLQGRALPADHATRNFFLRCLAMYRPELDEEFIMSDDDYRPLREVEESFFVRDGRYQAFYFYDLDRWPDNVAKPTSYDIQMQRTNVFLKDHGYPNLQYASHMPQIVCKRWFLDMLEEYPGLESTGCDEWSTYFNYAVKKHPESFDVRPYVTLSWPELPSSWDMIVSPPTFVFENFYKFLYESAGPFAGMETEFQSGKSESGLKALVGRISAKESMRRASQWQTFQDAYNENNGRYPGLLFAYGEGLEPGFVNLPEQMEMLTGKAYSLPVVFFERDASGSWRPGGKDIRIAYRWEVSASLEETVDWAGKGQSIVRVLTPANMDAANLELYYALGDGEYAPAGEILIDLVK